ncbi:hypothetical protein ANCDUO_25096 [Ancylostoma duodenale]|uniref:Amino acid transporter n=1 Tax=Ancylostoma duodenale TaxID=51022 RepID=A0A0C2FJ71_9BILA|nr:hypothetical protein ANCDUO_25096 [Ancylostoma duodenale]
MCSSKHSDDIPVYPKDEEKPVVENAEGLNVLGIIVFCIALGISLSQLGAEADVMIQFFAIMDKVIMKLVMTVMWYSPFGIMCLIMGKILEIHDLADTARMLAMYMVTFRIFIFTSITTN